MPSALRPPRSAPALTTSFSLPSVLADSPADPNVPVKDWTGPYASLSRRGNRWTLDVSGDDGDRSSDDAALVKTTPQRSLRQRRQLESRLASFETLRAEQADALELTNAANRDLQAEVDRLTAISLDAEDERLATEAECERLNREIIYLRQLAGVLESPPTAVSRSGSLRLRKRAGSAGRAYSTALGSATFDGSENAPLPPALGATKRELKSRALIGQRIGLRPASIRTEAGGSKSTVELSAAPRSAPLPAARVKARLQPVTTVGPTSNNGSPLRPALAARRKRSLDLLKQSNGLLEAGATSAHLGNARRSSPRASGRAAEAGSNGDEWLAIVRSLDHCRPASSQRISTPKGIISPVAVGGGGSSGSSSSGEDENGGVERRPNLRPSELPLSPRHARGSAPIVSFGSRSAPDGSEGELMEDLKRIVPEVNVRHFRHLVKKLDNAVLSPSSFLRATRTDVLHSSIAASNETVEHAGRASETVGGDGGGAGDERERWVLRLEDLVWHGDCK